MDGLQQAGTFPRAYVERLPDSEPEPEPESQREVQQEQQQAQLAGYSPQPDEPPSPAPAPTDMAYPVPSNVTNAKHDAFGSGAVSPSVAPDPFDTGALKLDPFASADAEPALTEQNPFAHSTDRLGADGAPNLAPAPAAPGK
eukprot:COSAG05_NODE_1297_length_5246_cov_2.847873_5_plen_142_part_00